jgi:aromatic ring-opening dioxygenase catalytic subunit (LigB family)
MGLDAREKESLAAYLRTLRTLAPAKKVVVVSAHWEESAPTVTTSLHPPMVYDYFGFPPAACEITWPAPGDPALAARVRELVDAAGFRSHEDATRGFDHGAFVPMKVAFPDADVSAIQLSLLSSLSPDEHLRLGRALAPLRDEGVLVVGSGMTYHNMRGFRGGADARKDSEAFDAWLRETVTSAPSDRDARLRDWTSAPRARAVHPREEHLLPLMVAAGAAGDDRGVVTFDDSFMGVRISGVQFG